jgi:predicted Rossmann-fold nucleotide-binding protein
MQVITWQQLGFHQKPIGLLNTEGFFDPLLKAFDSFISEVRQTVLQC